MAKQEDKKRNLSLIIGLSIPVAMVIFVAIAINGPRWFNTVDSATYDFLYTTGPHIPHAFHTVKDGRLIRNEQTVPDGVTVAEQPATRFFLHDVARNSSKEIPEEEAMALQLDGMLRSPDGFTVETGRRGGWYIFGFGRNYRNHYLVKERFSDKLDLETDTGAYNYYWNFRFLGWVVNDG